MKKFGEYGVHTSMMEWLDDAGWETWGAPERNEWGSEELDERYGREQDEVVYWAILKEKIVELNEKIDEAAAGDVIASLKRDLNVENLVESNRQFYNILRGGKKHTLGPEYDNETIKVRLIAHPDDQARDYSLEDNRFDAVTEFPVKLGDSIRPDVVLFVNGIPLVPVELKSMTTDSDVHDAVSDMKDYEEKEPRLFVPSLFNVAADGDMLKYAAPGAPSSFYFPWYSEEWDGEGLQPFDATTSLLRPETLMDIFRYFVFYEENQEKIVPRYMQYQAANRILDRVQRGEPRKGLIWHTQGSGKSYTMLFTAYKGKKSPNITDRQYLVIVDRQKLDEQMADTLASIDFPSYDVAKSIDNLGELLGEENGKLILTTIQKFADVDTDVQADLDLETVVMADEAHRFMEKDLGNRLHTTVPPDENFYFGFTGTPVKEGESSADRNTFREFSADEDGGYLHRYSLREGERDGVITPVTFTLKDIGWDIPDEAAMDAGFERSFEDLDEEERQGVLREYVNSTELSELRPRMERVVEDIYKHYEAHLEPIEFKGMVVTPSRRAAALYGDELEKYLPPGSVEVVISSSGDDPQEMQRHHLSDEEERDVIKRFKKPDEDPKILVVCEKLLTGFDAPVLKTLFLDQEMRNHRLLQAIARTNRPMDGKTNGEIVDYTGIFKDPDAVLEYDDVEFVSRAARNTDELAEEFLEVLNDLMDTFEDIDLNGRPETMQSCKVRLAKNPQLARTFEKRYQEAEDLYEAVSPHKMLGTDEVERKWSIITQIYRVHRKTEEGGDPLDDDVRAKTRSLLEKHIEFGDVETAATVDYEMPDRDVREVEGLPDEVLLVDEGGRLRRTLEDRDDRNLVYANLSDRVKRIMERWESDKISAREALEEIQDIKEQEERIENLQDELGLSDAEFAVYQLLVTNHRETVGSEEAAADIASQVGDAVADLNFDGNMTEVQRVVRREIIHVLVYRDLTELAKDDDFLSAATGYVMANGRR